MTLCRMKEEHIEGSTFYQRTVAEHGYLWTHLYDGEDEGVFALAWYKSIVTGKTIECFRYRMEEVT